MATLGVWWALVALPAILTLAGAFGVVGPNGPDGGMPGSLAGCWVGCYLAQLAMVFVLQHVAGHSHAWWFIVSSILPWAADWASPFGTTLGVVAILVTIAVAVLMGLLLVRQLHLDTHSVLIDATVERVLPNHVNIVVNSVYLRRRVQVRYTLPDGTPQERVLGVLTEIGDTFSAGDTIHLKVDPEHPRHVAVTP